MVGESELWYNCDESTDERDTSETDTDHEVGGIHTLQENLHEDG